MRAAFHALTGVALLVSAAVFAADAFVAGVEDLPLMPGLAAVPGDNNVVFDAPGGRIVEAWVQGMVNRDAVRAFYGGTLPQLGWTAAGPDLFRREGETLRLEFPASGPRGAGAQGGLLVRFYLSPG